jgi:ferritin-like metal-binding protein YciE
LSDATVPTTQQTSAGVLQRLKDTDAQIKALQQVLDGMEALGQNVDQQKSMLSALIQSRDLLTKAFSG